MAELNVLDDVSIADQAREILSALLVDPVLGEDVKDVLRRRMADRPDQPDKVLFEHLLESRKPTQGR
ncbi:hypothetical protein [Sinomonas gamaensis]|uniref:hypothetical protein n=1 Tax=Sinomonas gamaensis TaxID=2565624 RepID=UPI00110958A2|nr:hypothetical protein [Sinomonas gamaensis]